MFLPPKKPTDSFLKKKKVLYNVSRKANYHLRFMLSSWGGEGQRQVKIN